MFGKRNALLLHAPLILLDTASQPHLFQTYFTATLFTKAGIDLYVRGTLPQGAYDDIVARLKQHSGSDAASKELRALAADMFPIPTGNVKA